MHAIIDHDWRMHELANTKPHWHRTSNVGKLFQQIQMI